MLKRWIQRKSPHLSGMSLSRAWCAGSFYHNDRAYEIESFYHRLGLHRTHYNRTGCILSIHGIFQGTTASCFCFFGSVYCFYERDVVDLIGLHGWWKLIIQSAHTCHTVVRYCIGDWWRSPKPATRNPKLSIIEVHKYHSEEVSVRMFWREALLEVIPYQVMKKITYRILYLYRNFLLINIVWMKHKPHGFHTAFEHCNIIYIRSLQ